MDLAGRTLLGKYRIEKMLGRGGMGSVWRGEHTATGRPIAVKLLDERFAEAPSVVERFGREARAASAIRHEGIVEVLDLDRTEEGRPFIVMEFLEGQNLGQRLEAKGRLSERELADLADQLLDALDAAHERGVVHRDLKPDNIYLTPTRKGDRVKILDFGISSKADEKEHKLTATGSLLGTPHYLSPEQANAEANLDRRSDIYSCGVLFYECVVGEVPFDAPGLPRLLLSITEDPPVPPRTRGAKISEAMEAVLLKALSKRREARPQTAAVFRDLVLGAADGTLRVEDVTLDPTTLRSTLANRRRASLVPGTRPGATSDENRTLPASIGAAPGGAGPVATAPARKRPKIEADSNEPPALAEAGRGTTSRGSSTRAETRPATRAAEAPFHAGTLAGVITTPSQPRKAGRTSAAGPLSGMGGLDDLGPQKRIEVDAEALAVAKRMSDATGRHAAGSAANAREAGSDLDRSWGGVAVVAVLFGAVAVGAVFVLTNDDLRRSITGSSPVDIAFAAPPPVPDAGPDWVTVELTDLPPDATVTMNGLPVSGGELRVRYGTTHSIHVRAPGFVDRTIDVVGDADHAVSAALEPEAAAVRSPGARPRGGTHPSVPPPL